MSARERERAAQVADAIRAAGFRVFLAESGNYGFFTDDDGGRVVCFQCNGLRESISGNYKTSNPRSTGSGWQISDSIDTNPVMIREYFKDTAPRWAVGDATWRYTTLEEHLATYGKSSKYVERKT